MLVACPTYWQKSYCLDQYLAAYGAFSYPEKQLYMIDTTPDDMSYCNVIVKKGWTCDWMWVNEKMAPSMRITPVWRSIVNYAHSIGADFIASIEQDIIAPPGILEHMLGHFNPLRNNGVTCSYPTRGGIELVTNGVGCCILPTNLLWRLKWDGVFEKVVQDLNLIHIGNPGLEHLGKVKV